ncbi:glucose-6-phosphate dehydrogenase [Anaerorhabdus furcosa]|uniref:Glucose-6-phosphate 1-dehydrogenase n=1 Tax=Anaerorhabdus furcosa TaxID=118967 RepID=A0A1T4L9H6_9FIRM|nr:glucose-6-phosphate dehydrogenase [Anaerorhabdus furcosa]SJZ51253.1 glucose-6-phosphate 1-dehydrogenase [Anaerorhabdus furcosa]
MNGKNSGIVIFGGTGDLAYRKLMPALYNLFGTSKLGNDKIIAIGRREYTQEEYHHIIHEWIKQYSRIKYDEKTFLEFSNKVFYYKMNFTELDEYEALAKYFKQKEITNPIFYYAVAPEYFEVITDGVMSIQECCHGRIIIEKPFGDSLEQANQLSEKLEKSFGKENIYRIDHYLGKEMIRNIETIRFDNPIFANNWNYEGIENVQIQALEEVGVETRGNYYDHAGALKDMVQNHLMQILTLVAMEKPTADISISDRQVEVLKSLRSVGSLVIEDSLVLGQYEGYKNELNVASDSNTETYAALKLFIDNRRWKEVPFYIKTGKKTGSREMNVIITFKKVNPDVQANVLTIKIQPLEGISLKFNMKEPGDSEKVIQTEMDFCQSCIARNRINTPEAYERLLLQCMQGDQSWFSEWGQIYLSWKYIDELKEEYKKQELPIYEYEQNSTGPREVDQILNDESHVWAQSQLICKM